MVRSRLSRPAAESNHQLDPQDVIDAISANTCAIVLNSPSNPTGTLYPRETIEAIVQEAAYRGVYVISDEVYDHLVYDDKTYPSVLSCCSDLDHVMVISSFSKTFSMAGMRVGWLIASQGAIKKLRRYHMFTTTVAEYALPVGGGWRLCVASVISSTICCRSTRSVGIAWWNWSDRLRFLRATSRKGPSTCFPRCPRASTAITWALRLLKETGVCTIPGETFGPSCSNALRISYSTSIAQIEEAFRRLIPWMERQDFA